MSIRRPSNASNRHRATSANERCGAIHLDHGEPPAGGCNRVAFSCVSLLSNLQRVQLGLESAPIDHSRYSKFISHGVLHRSASIGEQFRSIVAPFMPLE